LSLNREQNFFCRSPLRGCLSRFAEKATHNHDRTPIRVFPQREHAFNVRRFSKLQALHYVADACCFFWLRHRAPRTPSAARRAKKTHASSLRFLLAILKTARL
jgi:hypothetical protein